MREPGDPNWDDARKEPKEVVKVYAFSIQLIGRGNTSDEAFEDALENVRLDKLHASSSWPGARP